MHWRCFLLLKMRGWVEDGVLNVVCLVLSCTRDYGNVRNMRSGEEAFVDDMRCVSKIFVCWGEYTAFLNILGDHMRILYIVLTSRW